MADYEATQVEILDRWYRLVGQQIRGIFVNNIVTPLYIAVMRRAVKHMKRESEKNGHNCALTDMLADSLECSARRKI